LKTRSALIGTPFAALAFAGEFMITKCLAVAMLIPWCTSFVAEAQPSPANPDAAPIYRVTVVSRTLSAINYQHRSGPTKIDFTGTVLLPAARGEATIESKKGRIEIDSKFDHLDAPHRFGGEYLIYVLWAITPEGRAVNLGEVLPGRSDKADLHVTTDLQVFGLMVTAEPYFSVSRPSDVVVLENVVRPDTIGSVEQVSAKYELLPRGQYTYNVKASSIRSADADAPKVSMDQYEALMELYQAQNAVQIAGSLGADRYAPDTYNKAVQLLRQAQDWQAQKMSMRTVVTVARDAAQTAEDARAITVKRRDEERLAQDQQIVAKAEGRAQEAESRAEAEHAHAESERIAKEQAQAEAARANQLAQQAQAGRDAAAASQVAANPAGYQRQESDKRALRAQLLRELSPILDTRDSPRGLLITIPDSQFQSPSTLRDGFVDELGQIASVLRSRPGLYLEVDGHTDNEGADTYVQQLSERRAATVRDVLVRDGIPPNMIVIRAFGKTRPLLSNDTPAGRARNRRVEVVISGDPIGGTASWDQTYTLMPRQ
jgi:outer membrane protein OmpA-like peptidoglycan-associated protein